MSIFDSCLACEMGVEVITRSNGTQDREIADERERQLNPHCLGSAARSYKLERASANANLHSIRPRLPKTGPEALMKNFKQANIPIEKAGKTFVPAWKQKSVDAINRIRTERRGEFSGVLLELSNPIYV